MFGQNHNKNELDHHLEGLKWYWPTSLHQKKKDNRYLKGKDIGSEPKLKI
jgi:hypothetical protein